MFKKLIFAVLSLAFALNYFQQMHAEPVVQNSNKYSAFKNAVIKYGKPVMDIGSLALGAYTIKPALTRSDCEQKVAEKLALAIDTLSPEEQEIGDLGGMKISGAVAGSIVICYALNSLYTIYKDYKNGKQEAQPHVKHSWSRAALVGFKSFISFVGIIQTLALLHYTHHYRNKLSFPYTLAIITCWAKTAYLTGSDAYTYWTTKKQVSETKKA